MATFKQNVSTVNGRTTHTLRVEIWNTSTDESGNSSTHNVRVYYDVDGYDNFIHRSNIYLKINNDVFIDSVQNVSTIQNGSVLIYSRDGLYYRHSDAGDLSIPIHAKFSTVQKGLSYLPRQEFDIRGTYNGPKINRSVRLVENVSTIYLWHPLDTGINGQNNMYYTFEKTSSAQTIECWYKIGNKSWETIASTTYGSNRYRVVFNDSVRKKMAELASASEYENIPTAQLSVRTHNPGGSHVDQLFNLNLGYLLPERAIPQIYSITLNPDISIPNGYYIKEAANYNIRILTADGNTPRSSYPQIRNYSLNGQTSIYKNMSDADMEWCLRYYVGTYTKYNYDMRGPNNIDWNGGHDISALFNKDTLYHRFLNSGQYTVKVWTKNVRSSISKELNNQNINVLPYSKPIITNLQAVRNGVALDREIIITCGFRWFRVHNLQKITASITVLEKDTGKQVGFKNIFVDAVPGSEELSDLRHTIVGTFQLNREYTVRLDVKDMSNVNVSFAQTVPVDQIIAYIGKSGVGINKQHALGALDVTGDIYANGKRIQQYPLTLPNGYVERLWTNTNGSGDEYRTPGQYYVQVSDNGLKWALLEVFQVTEKEIIQRFTIIATGKVWYRISDYQTGVFGRWYHTSMS